jgi:hypothetical protein
MPTSVAKESLPLQGSRSDAFHLPPAIGTGCQDVRVSDEPDHPLTEEELAARRSNRRTLIVVLLFVVVLGVLPLVAVLLDKLS